MTTLIIGANGQIGRLLVKQLAAAGDRPRAMIRDAAQADALGAMGAEPVVGDLEGQFAQALEGCDRVVFTAGSGGHTGADKTVLIDLWGAIRAVDAARQAGIRQFVMVSSRGAEDPDAGPGAARHYRICKHLADRHLINSGQPYTILRPGRLTDDPAEGRISTAWPSERDEQWITRADVADAIAHCLTTPATLGRIYPLFHGDQPIDRALI